MSHIRTTALLVSLGAVALSGPAAQAATKVKVETRCFYVGNVRGERTVSGSGLLPDQLRFRSLTTRYDYALTLKGTYKTWWDHGRWAQFIPRRFLIQGGSTATAARHPKGKPLTSLTELKFHSTDSNTSFGVGWPPSFSVSWDSQKKVMTSKNRATAPGTTRSVDSAVAGTANPFTGKAGKDGARKIGIRSAVIASRGTNPFYAGEQTWKIDLRYEARDSPFPLREAGCSGLNWG